MYKKLLKIDTELVSNVPFKDQWVECRLIKVLDGDTISVAMLLGEYPLKINVRILGVDCPESSRRQTKNEQEILAGKKVTEYTKILLKDIVKVKLTGIDKYGGRWLGDVMVEISDNKHSKESTQILLSEHLVQKKYARVYKGDKKLEWTDKELDYILSV